MRGRVELLLDEKQIGGAEYLYSEFIRHRPSQFHVRRGEVDEKYAIGFAGAPGVNNRVPPPATAENVRVARCVRDERPDATDQKVVAGAAIEYVGADPAQQLVVAGAAREIVDAGASLQVVVSVASLANVVALTQPENVIAGLAVDRIGSGPAEKKIAPVGGSR